jgi:hypothetical protein
MNNSIYRMAQMQLMNVVNMGVLKNLSIECILVSATAMIDATQLFLTDAEVNQLRIQLQDRIEKQKISV